MNPGQANYLYDFFKFNFPTIEEWRATAKKSAKKLLEDCSYQQFCKEIQKLGDKQSIPDSIGILGWMISIGCFDEIIPDYRC